MTEGKRVRRSNGFQRTFFNTALLENAAMLSGWNTAYTLIIFKQRLNFCFLTIYAFVVCNLNPQLS